MCIKGKGNVADRGLDVRVENWIEGGRASERVRERGRERGVGGGGGVERVDNSRKGRASDSNRLTLSGQAD